MKSMTGYGRASAQNGGYDITVEIRAVNHRFYECSVKLPRAYSYLEEKIKDQLQSRIARGKVEVSLTMQNVGGKSLTVQVNHTAVSAYLTALLEENRRLAEELDGGISEHAFLKQDLSLSTLLRLPDAFQVQQVTEDAEVVWAAVEPLLQDAVEQFLSMRMVEGERLKADVASHLDALEQMTFCVEKLAPETVQLYYDKLYRKITELLADHTVDESRLVTEAAVVAEKIAVDEELVRLHSHIAQFRTLLESDVPVGRKMDFLVQEMNREVNTTGSKSQSLEITKLVVDMKSEIEKIREQIQNIE
ncbi:YicC/YloC family endoribonuclease [uncultured Ruminococcus sp.]|uniref:YicC/YloC family endoribonuclease n=1 Tax=uncultured Ruminococcus sp. TaxID=165186 RepID=UPI0026020BCF|nr:YicC/YloC family endoribonuclease [uncultured Ruminococcus sp.]